MVARASSLSGIKNPHMRRRAECTRRRRCRRRCTRRMFFFSSLLCRVNNCHSCSFFSKKTEPSTAALRGFNSHRTPPPPTHTRSQCPHRCNGYNTPLPQRRRPHACILLCPFFFFSSLPLLKQRKKSPPPTRQGPEAHKKRKTEQTRKKDARKHGISPAVGVFTAPCARHYHCDSTGRPLPGHAVFLLHRVVLSLFRRVLPPPPTLRAQCKLPPCCRRLLLCMRRRCPNWV